MRKLFIFLMAALAVFGSGFAYSSIANAGTVTIAGSTNLTIGGFILGYYGESSNQNLVSSQANNPGIIKRLNYISLFFA